MQPRNNFCLNIDMKKKLEIGINKTTSELKKEFNKQYPFLKIEFFREPCIKGTGFTKDKLIKRDEKLGNLQREIKQGHFTFSDSTIVDEFEKLFFKKFGLCVQVFRKSGNVWLETSATDDWTLLQQNEEGEQLAQHFKVERENPDDHDMY